MLAGKIAISPDDDEKVLASFFMGGLHADPQLGITHMYIHSRVQEFK